MLIVLQIVWHYIKYLDNAVGSAELEECSASSFLENLPGKSLGKDYSTLSCQAR